MKNYRLLMEREVVAMNKYLKDAVKDMNIIILLRNCHPLYREDHALTLYKNGIITREQAIEFTKKIKL